MTRGCRAAPSTRGVQHTRRGACAALYVHVDGSMSTGGGGSTTRTGQQSSGTHAGSSSSPQTVCCAGLRRGNDEAFRSLCRVVDQKFSKISVHVLLQIRAATNNPAAFNEFCARFNTDVPRLLDEAVTPSSVLQPAVAIDDVGALFQTNEPLALALAGAAERMNKQRLLAAPYSYGGRARAGGTTPL